MKILLEGPFIKNTRVLMRDIGYHFQGETIDRGELMFTHPARGYPRFHIYLKEGDGKIMVNLHLDHKKPIYKNSVAHSAEYDGDIVEAEGRRIKSLAGK
ncbi:MAG: hypothetical protein ABID67_02020 [Candidatus Nealsonbacteria bacterium]